MADEFTSDRLRDGNSDDLGRGRHTPLVHAYGGVGSQLTYSSVIAALYNGSYLPPSSVALARDPDSYRIMRANPVVRQCDDILRRAVAGRSWRLQPGDDTDAAKRLAEICTSALNHIVAFDEARVEMGSAMLRGEYYGHVKLRRMQTTLKGARGEWVVPVKITDIDPRRVRWAKGPFGEYRREIRAIRPPNDWRPVPRDWPLICSIYNDEESRLGRGEGLEEALMVLCYVWGVMLQIECEGMETHATGILTAKVDLARAGSTEAMIGLANEWTEHLEEVRRRRILVHDNADDWNVIMGGEAGATAASGSRQSIEDLIRNLMLGSNLPFGGGAQGEGSRARADTEKGVSKDRIVYDQKKQGEDIERQLVHRWCRWNRFPLLANGILPTTAKPKFEVDSAEDDPEERRERLKDAKELGLPIIVSEAYDILGFSQPGPNDETVFGQEAMPGGGMGMMPGAMPGMGGPPPPTPTLGGDADPTGQNDIAGQQSPAQSAPPAGNGLLDGLFRALFAEAAQIGEVRTWADGKQYQKTANGWVPVNGDGEAAEHEELTTPGETDKRTVGQRIKDAVGKVAALMRDPKAAASATASAVSATTAKMAGPLKEAGYSDVAAKSIAAVAAVIAVSPFSISGAIAAAGLGPAALYAVPGALEAGAIVQGAASLRRPVAALKGAIKAGAAIRGRLKARKERRESDRAAIEQLQREYQDARQPKQPAAEPVGAGV